MAARSPALKDETLSRLAQEVNVAQFASFSPSLEVRYSCIRDFSDERHIDVNSRATALFERAHSGTVNVRTFHPTQKKSLPFHYGIRSIEKAIETVRHEAEKGLYTIVNETIDVNDGGISGVALGGIVEFSPDDTPRCVEKKGTLSLPIGLAQRLLTTVYGVWLQELGNFGRSRVEFSLHPLRQGYRADHVVYWEVENVGDVKLDADVRWPNNFSRKIGDKSFGLLVAHLLGLRVPETLVISRSIAPFRFGASTGSTEHWTRTCPAVQHPGEFTTVRGYADPFDLLQREDPTSEIIAAVLIQTSVDAQFSGATVPIAYKAEHRVEGVRGYGDRFMLGEIGSTSLPDSIVEDVQTTVRCAEELLGARVRIEWAHDGETVWVLQFHRARGRDRPGVIVPGSPGQWVQFDASEGIAALELLVEQLSEVKVGILVTGEIGVTSHLGDVLRRSRTPARLLSEDFPFQQSLLGEDGCQSVAGRTVIAGDV